MEHLSTVLPKPRYSVLEAANNAAPKAGTTPSPSSRLKLLGQRIDAALVEYWRPDLDRETTALNKREWLAVLSDLAFEHVDQAFNEYARKPINHTVDGRPLPPHKSQIRDLALDAQSRAAPKQVCLPTMTESEPATLWRNKPGIAARKQAIAEATPGCGIGWINDRASQLLDEHFQKVETATGTRA